MKFPIQHNRIIEDQEYGANTKFYTLPSGTSFVHTIDPKTTDSSFYSIFKAGALHEKKLGVETGTAHFLEHMISSNPNSRFKSKIAIDNFAYGTVKHPRIMYNAWTSRFVQSHYGYTNNEGENRIAQFFKASLLYPEQNFEKYIEKERKIIRAERAGKLKPEESVDLAFLRFIFDNTTEYSNYLLGEDENILNITTEMLTKFYKHAFTSDRTAIALQTATDEIHKDMIDALYAIDDHLGKHKNSFNHEINEKFINKEKVTHFQDKRAQGVSMDIVYFDLSKAEKIDYRLVARNYLVRSLINKVSFDYLREKRGLVYSAEAFNASGLSVKYDVVGFSASCSLENYDKLISETKRLFEKEIPKFARSAQGKRWYQDVVSRYIYPNTYEFNREYAFGKAYAQLHNYEISEFEKRKQAIVNTTIDDVLSEYEKMLKIPKATFVSSDQESEKMIGMLKS